MVRNSGILLHLTSLPARFGIGDLGKEAYRFADFLKDTGQHLWQILPLGPTGYGNSPYQCLSVFAGNPLLISPGKLAEDGWLETADLKNAPLFPEHTVDYDAVSRFKSSLLSKSFRIFDSEASPAEKGQFAEFCRENAGWLDNFALFLALKGAFGFKAWNTWPEDVRKREPDAINRWQQKMADGNQAASIPAIPVFQAVGRT